MDSELTFKAISCGLVLLIWLTTVALLWISMTKEWRLGQPARGVFGLIVAALCLCAFIVLVAAYVQKTRSLRKISHRIEAATFDDELPPSSLRTSQTKSIEPAKRPKPCYTGRGSDVAVYMRHLRDLVVRPSLKALHPEIPYSQNAECLVMETIAHESGVGAYLNQYPDGPAGGIAQIEEPTFFWLKDLTSTRYQSIGTKLFQLFGEPEHDQLSARMDLSVAFCRLRYFIVKEPIPDTLEGRASYWARYYQTTNDPQKIRNYIDDAKRYL
jgi:hypothetical protein